MKKVFIESPGNVVVEDVPEPTVQQPTDAVIRVLTACVCGSDLWPYRGIVEAVHKPMGHEYVGVVESVGSAVHTVQPGDPVVGSFMASDNDCEICDAGYPSHCPQAVRMATLGTQAEKTLVPFADGTLVKLPETPSAELLPSVLAASDVLGTGWFGAVAAEAGPGKSVAVVGDGAVGLMAILAAKQLGAEQIIAMSRHTDRQALAREFGATHIVEERGDEGAAHIKELTNGYGAHSVVEAVGTRTAVQQAISCCRPGGHVGYVGLPHAGEIAQSDLFFGAVHLHGGFAPVRRFLPEFLELIWAGKINPGKVFTRTLPLVEAAEAYRLMDQREEIKVMLTV